MRTFLPICLLLITACASSSKKLAKRGFIGTKLGYSANSGTSYFRTSGYSRGPGLGSYATGFNSGLSLHSSYAPDYYSLGKSTDNFASSTLGLSSYGLGKNERITGITVNREIRIPVPVPQPYPVQVTRAVPVPQPYPVKVDRPYPVLVPHPVPIQVTRTVPVKIDRPYPVPVPVHVPEPVPVPVNVDALQLAANSYSGTGSDFHSGYVSGTGSGSYSASGSSSGSYSNFGSGTFSGFESGSYSTVDSGTGFHAGSGASFGSNLPLLQRNEADSGYSYPAPSKKFAF